MNTGREVKGQNIPTGISLGYPKGAKITNGVLLRSLRNTAA